MYMYFFCWLPRLLLLLLLLPPRHQTERRECPSCCMGILYCHHREHDWKLHQYLTFVVGTCIYVVSGGLRQKPVNTPVMMVTEPPNLLVHFSLLGQDSTVQRRRRDCDQPFPATNICANICHGGSQDGMAIHSLYSSHTLTHTRCNDLGVNNTYFMTLNVLSIPRQIPLYSRATGCSLEIISPTTSLRPPHRPVR